MVYYGTGPKNLWEHEMEKLSRHALLALCRHFIFGQSYFGLTPEEMRSEIADAKKHGRTDAFLARWDRYDKDPEKALRETLLRRRSAKKAARRRKAENRKAKKGVA